jgi:hypothetical protein
MTAILSRFVFVLDDSPATFSAAAIFSDSSTRPIAGLVLVEVAGRVCFVGPTKKLGLPTNISRTRNKAHIIRLRLRISVFLKNSIKFFSFPKLFRF